MVDRVTVNNKKEKPEVVRIRLSKTFVTVPLSMGVNEAKEDMDEEVRERLKKFKIKLK
jgi:hypothetical protein